MSGAHKHYRCDKPLHARRVTEIGRHGHLTCGGSRGVQTTTPPRRSPRGCNLSDTHAKNIFSLVTLARLWPTPQAPTGQVGLSERLATGDWRLEAFRPRSSACAVGRRQ
eukprot:scaffold193468_cov36-Tisochrysis_lutea.AAC.1